MNYVSSAFGYDKYLVYYFQKDKKKFFFTKIIFNVTIK